MTVTVIGRGHSGTRSMSHTLSQSGVYMGEPLNVSGDLLPPEPMYEACRVFARNIKYLGNMKWDFSSALESEPSAEFVSLIEEYLKTVLSHEGMRGWKIPETTLCYPWILKMFPDIKYIHWVRDPRDCVLASHVTDDLYNFGIEYDKSDDIRYNRAVSWYYQRELVRRTPEAKNMIKVRFEDMVLDQENTLKRLEAFLGIPLARIEMRRDSVGRYKLDGGVNMFDFFADDMKECGYEF